MKKHIVINILLVLILAFVLCVTILYWKNFVALLNLYEAISQNVISYEEYWKEYGLDRTLTLSILGVFASLSLIATIILLNLSSKFLRAMQDKIEKANLKHCDKKNKKAALKKQKKINKLESELTKLKND